MANDRKNNANNDIGFVGIIEYREELIKMIRHNQ